MNRVLACVCGGLFTALSVAGCAGGGESYRRAWVDPATVTDQAAYARDLEECRLEAKVAFDEHRAANRSPGAGAATGGGAFIAGGLLMGPVGAVAGGATGGTLAETPALQEGTKHMYATNRECLRRRGYTPLQ